MGNFINGYSTPRILIKDINNNLIETVDLMLTGSDGLTEEYEFFYIEHNLINYSTVKTFKGYHINFNLSYTEYSPKSNSFKIMNLINYIFQNNYKLILYPRSEILSRYFEVNFSGNPLELGIMRGGSKAIGNHGIELNFRTKYLQTNLNWLDPDDVITPLDDFITL